MRFKFKKELSEFKLSFIKGVGWAFGITVGFVLVSSLFLSILGRAGGLPLIGEWIADAVQSANQALEITNPIRTR